MLSFAVDLYKVLNASIPGLLLLSGEIAGRKFSVFPMISYALAAFALSGTAGISAVAFLKISFDFTFQNQYLPLFSSSPIVSDLPESIEPIYLAVQKAFLH